MNSPDDVLTRTDLMRQLETSWNELERYFASLTVDQLTQPTDAAGWTAKDHIIHLATWEKACLAMLEGKSKREAIDIPLEVWEQDDDPVNAIIQQRYQHLSVDEVMHTLRDNHARLLDKLNTMSEADFQRPYRHYQPESSHEIPISKFIEWDTAHHYRDHLSWITAIVEG